MAHRLAYEAHIGPIPTGMFVCHKCDNPSCVNPDHLFLGTHQDNMTDKVVKHRHCHGETHGMHKLNEQQVVELILAGNKSTNELAAMLGVTPDHIAVIRSGKAWKHLHNGARSATS